MATSTIRLLSPEEIAVQAGQQVPFLSLPERSTVYAERAMRLRQRAAGHAMRDYLLFIADLAEAQQAALARHPAVPLPEAVALASAARLGAVPLPAMFWPRDPAWRDVLRELLVELQARLADGPARRQVQALRDADDAWLEQQADRLLGQRPIGLDLAAAPLIAAGLQVHWTHLVLATDAAGGRPDAATARPASDAPGAARSPLATPIPAAFGRVDDPTRCPCCASPPTASIVRIGGDDAGFRYLHCALCAAQWHMVRIKCARCLSTAGIHYHALQRPDDDTRDASARAPAAVEAETCDACGHYLKIVHMARDPHVEPVADDLASVTLDLTVAEAGYERHGVDLMLLYGDDAAAEDEDATDAADDDLAPPPSAPTSVPPLR